MLKEISSVFSFLTIIPSNSTNLEAVARYMHIFPIIGIAIGLLIGSIGFGLSFFLEPLIVSLLVVASLAIITGIHHTDGLADFADGLMTRGTKEKKCKAMKDISTGSAGIISEIHMPLWVIFAAASAMGLGTFFGGYKVIKTLGLKITRLKPYQGFAAQTGGGMMLAIFAVLGIPASTTHAITGSVMGAGAARRIRAVRWKVSRQIIFSWVITIPGAAGLAIAFTYIIHLFV